MILSSNMWPEANSNGVLDHILNVNESFSKYVMSVKSSAVFANQKLIFLFLGISEVVVRFGVRVDSGVVRFNRHCRWYRLFSLVRVDILKYLVGHGTTANGLVPHLPVPRTFEDKWYADCR